MRLVESLPEIERNVEVLAKYLARPSTPDGEFALDLIARGICFFATTRDGAPFFAPSRFIGYTGNSRTDHLSNADKDGRDTNPAISKILGGEPAPSAELETMYLRFCERNGVEKKVDGKLWPSPQVLESLVSRSLLLLAAQPSKAPQLERHFQERRSLRWRGLKHDHLQRQEIHHGRFLE